MRKSFLRLVAVFTLGQVCLLYGGGLLLAYEEQFRDPQTSCARACCHLAKAGSPYAKSCCTLRCGEVPTDPEPEPARAKQSAPLGVAVVLATQPRPSIQEAWTSARSLTTPTEAPERQLYLRHSILLV